MSGREEATRRLGPTAISSAPPSALQQQLMGRDYFDTNIKAADQSEIRAHVKQTDGAGGHEEREPTEWSASMKKKTYF